MTDLQLRDLARSMGISETELRRELAARGIPVLRGRVEVRHVIELFTLYTLLRTRLELEEVVKKPLTEPEEESPLTASAAKALELAGRLARDMAHPAVAGPHVLIGLTLVADPVLAEIPSLAVLSRRSLMDAVGESKVLARNTSFLHRRSTLPHILARARKEGSGGEIEARDLLAAVLADSITRRMLRRTGVVPKKLETEVRSVRQPEAMKAAA